MSQIVTLYSDKENTDALYPRTKVSAILDDNNTPLKELMTGMVKQEEGGTEEEVVTPINADTLGGKLTANNVVFYEEEMVDEFGQVVVKNADKLENHPASYFATNEELVTKANKSNVLTLEEIQASTDLSGKIASAISVKELRNETITIGNLQSDNGTCEGGWLKIGRLAVITGVFTPSSNIPIETVIIYGIPSVGDLSNNVPFVVRDNTETTFNYFKLQNAANIATDSVLKNGHSYRFTVCYVCKY